MYFAIRISKPWADIKESILEWFPKCPVIVYQHDITDNIHCHMLLNYDKKEDSLRNIFKKCYNKNEYSLKTTYKIRESDIRTPVNENFIAYMSKGTLAPLYVNIISQDVITEQTSKGFDKGTDIVPSPEDKAKKQLTKYDMVQLIAEQVKLVENKEQVPIILEVIRTVCLAKKQFQFLGMYEMVKLYDCWLAQERPQHYINQIYYKIQSRSGM